MAKDTGDTESCQPWGNADGWCGKGCLKWGLKSTLFTPYYVMLYAPFRLQPWSVEI